MPAHNKTPPRSALLLRHGKAESELLIDEVNFKMHFFLNIIPMTKTYQEHRVGKRKDGSIYFYEDAELRKVRELYRAHLSKHIPERPLQGPIRLLVKWCFPRGKHPNGSYKTTKPDTDNLNKLLKDIMTDLGYWNDDAQVASEIIEKFWADIPGIYIEVSELGE